MWNTGAPQPERPADLLFVDYLYNWVTSNYNVDKSRVYASGQSSGGMMSLGLRLLPPRPVRCHCPRLGQDP